MTFDAEAYAEGICNSAAGSSIEVLVDVFDALIGEGGIIDDAIYYRGYDSDGELSEDEDDRESAQEYERINEKLTELRAAIVQRESDNDENTTFGD